MMVGGGSEASIAHFKAVGRKEGGQFRNWVPWAVR